MYTVLCCALSSELEFGDRLCHSSSDTWLFGGTLLHKSALVLCASDHSWLQVFFIIGGSEHTGTVTCFGVHLSYIIDGQDRAKLFPVCIVF